LAEVAGGEIDESEALFEIGVLDFAGGGSFGDERPGRARGVFSEEDGDGFAVWGPRRRGEETFYVGEFFGGASRGGSDVELKLAGLRGVGEKSDLLAVAGPGDAAFGARSVDSCGGETFWRGGGVGVDDENGGVAVGGAVFANEGFDPGDFFLRRGRWRSVRNGGRRTWC
jgi:hypothetical protein